MRSWIESARAHIHLRISILLHVLFYILFTVSCRLRCVMRWHSAGLQTCNESAEDDTSGTIDECTNIRFYVFFGLDRKTNVSAHTHRHPPSTINLTMFAVLRLLFNEPKRMNAFATKFYRNEQNKIEINVFLCYVYPDRKYVLGTACWYLLFTLCALCIFVQNTKPNTSNSIWRNVCSKSTSAPFYLFNILSTGCCEVNF